MFNSSATFNGENGLKNTIEKLGSEKSNLPEKFTENRPGTRERHKKMNREMMIEFKETQLYKMMEKRICEFFADMNITNKFSTQINYYSGKQDKSHHQDAAAKISTKAYRNTNITVAASFGRPWSTIEFKNISTKQIITLDVEEGSVYAFGEGRVSANQIKIVFTLFYSDEFFFHSEKSGRSITAAPDKIFTQTFFQGIEEG